MNRMLALVLIFAVALVSGCSTHHAVEQRAFSAEESHQLALEDLNRRGLSFEEYQARKAQLLADPQIQQAREFDDNGETSVDVSVMGQSPRG
ncbi:hypothetical protein RYA05_27400 [Pseudomonas syringae pv. actinidiae]|uniref:Lipoprotein n=3 Tax=Pseudomonas syringae group TaxID=136849 RepID=A0A261WMS5_9PSED|nr:hypothetical protein [Pseudomonas syringae]EPN13838.1 lipoprotein [Pseudomonas syringae pv. actinidiae ICMP 19070]EPN61943.1 lipoprotein [Pseudomonas syringae pv. actinidiae ICMP 19079]EPN86238.1 lipoprotein [Pseudomonas syringae pv. actinidiae ICMP 19101]OZI87511.1 hypothetical protein CFN58_03510 [Pseudomonas avellanae]AKT30105.1 lipoprotein [Pseudomonas syringae pv. actinidiae ICMP 18884]